MDTQCDETVLKANLCFCSLMLYRSFYSCYSQQTQHVLQNVVAPLDSNGTKRSFAVKQASN